VDPGLCSGVAVFDAGMLTYAIDAGVPGGFWPAVETLVVEIPEVYPGTHEEDPNDLIKVAVCAGRWIEVMKESAARSGVSLTVADPHPRQWKGQVPKRIHNARVLEKLKPAELALVPKLAKTRLHNVIDAIGLGLWKLGRIGRGA
jgi:hypothetical protein